MKPQSNKGSVLVAAVILGTIMALAAASYIALSLGSLKRANRSFYYNSAVDMAESGAEEAMWALNANGGKGVWTKKTEEGEAVWVASGNDRLLMGSVAKPEFTDMNGAKGYYNVFVKDATDGTDPGPNPIITVEGVFHLASGTPIRKQIKLTASSEAIPIPPFCMVEGGKLNGGEIDSYLMSQGTYATAPRRYNAGVASPTIEMNEVVVGSPADVYGYLSIGLAADDPATATFLSSIKGSLAGKDTAAGQDGVVKNGSNLVDTNRISYDYTQDFPVEDAPGDAATAVVLPTADANGIIQIGDPTGATEQVYRLDTLDVASTETLLIRGPVTIIVTGATNISGAVNVLSSQTYNVMGKGAQKNTVIASYAPSAYAAAELYGEGNMAIGGNGIIAAQTDPAKLRIFGTGDTTQTITVGGNGDLAAILWAPMAAITFNGGGSTGAFAGTLVGRYVTVNGQNFKIRYPEDMVGGNILSAYHISKWFELTDPADKHTF